MIASNPQIAVIAIALDLMKIEIEIAIIVKQLELIKPMAVRQIRDIQEEISKRR